MTQGRGTTICGSEATFQNLPEGQWLPGAYRDMAAKIFPPHLGSVWSRHNHLSLQFQGTLHSGTHSHTPVVHGDSCRHTQTHTRVVKSVLNVKRKGRFSLTSAGDTGMLRQRDRGLAPCHTRATDRPTPCAPGLSGRSDKREVIASLVPSASQPRVQVRTSKLSVSDRS